MPLIRLASVRILLVTASVALAVTSCSATKPEAGGSVSPSMIAPSESPAATPSGSGSPEPVIVPAMNLDEVKVEGGFGNTPKVKLPGPWGIAKTQTKVLEPGTGTPVVATSTVEVQYQGVDGRTGAIFDENFSTGKPIAFSLGQVIAGFRTGLVGQKVGSRVVIGVTGLDGYDSVGGSESVGIKVGDTLIFVVDILSATLPGPTGTTITPPAGLPTVVDEQGKPVVTIGKTLAKPSSLVIQPLVVGSGKKIAATDTLQVNYTLVAWSTGKVVKQTYGYMPLSGALNTTIQGWQKGLVGQTVGSRVLLVVPPADAYPNGNPPLGIEAGETLVFVVDILFRQVAAA